MDYLGSVNSPLHLQILFNDCTGLSIVGLFIDTLIKILWTSKLPSYHILHYNYVSGKKFKDVQLCIVR